MQKPRHILAIRFSAMGDVAMAVPVIKALLQQYPWLNVTFVSNAFHAPLFKNIDRCKFFAAHTKGIHKGFAGIWKLYMDLKSVQHFDAVADLHNVLRSNILRKFFRLSGVANRVIDKGRAEKKQLTSKENKILKQLPASHENYSSVFAALGWPVDLENHDYFAAKETIPATIPSVLLSKKLVGIAPFAKHAEKMYPLQKMKELVLQLAKQEGIQLIFFGARGSEAVLLEAWQNEIPSSFNLAGKISFSEELQLISNLSLMISMDSANMHLASIYGVPVVSIWGATHPFAGFYGWKQEKKNIVQVELFCRPCSVFGNKPCYRGDHACMEMISNKMILEKINENL